MSSRRVSESFSARLSGRVRRVLAGLSSAPARRDRGFAAPAAGETLSPRTMLTAAPTGSIAVEVLRDSNFNLQVDTEDTPQAGLDYVITDYDDNYVASGRTDRFGRFEVEGLEADRYVVRVYNELIADGAFSAGSNIEGDFSSFHYGSGALRRDAAVVVDLEGGDAERLTALLAMADPVENSRVVGATPYEVRTNGDLYAYPFYGYDENDDFVSEVRVGSLADGPGHTEGIGHRSLRTSELDESVDVYEIVVAGISDDGRTIDAAYSFFDFETVRLEALVVSYDVASGEGSTILDTRALDGADRTDAVEDFIDRLYDGRITSVADSSDSLLFMTGRFDSDYTEPMDPRNAGTGSPSEVEFFRVDRATGELDRGSVEGYGLENPFYDYREPQPIDFTVAGRRAVFTWARDFVSAPETRDDLLGQARELRTFDLTSGESMTLTDSLLLDVTFGDVSDDPYVFDVEIADSVAVSGDGRYVAYREASDEAFADLFWNVSDANPSRTDRHGLALFAHPITLHDLETGEKTEIAAPGREGSELPLLLPHAISSDGGRMLLVAKSFHDAETDEIIEYDRNVVFEMDLATGETRQVGLAPHGGVPAYEFRAVHYDADDRIVVTYDDDYVDGGEDLSIVSGEPNALPRMRNLRILTHTQATGAVLGQIAASDPDGDRLTYRILEGRDGGLFRINPNDGRIVIDGGQTRADLGAGTYVFRVAVSDDGFPSLQDIATVRVDIVEGNVPPQMRDRSVMLSENSPVGTGVVRMAATDPDSDGPITYTIVGGNDEGAFRIDAATGRITVADKRPLDFETKRRFALVVAATDAGNPAIGLEPATTEAVVRIALTNRIETPKVISRTVTRPENMPAGKAVGRVGVVAEPGRGVRFRMTGGNTDGAFRIDQSTGRVFVANAEALDFETNPVFDLRITVSDAETNAGTDSGLLRIRLTDVYDSLELDWRSIDLPLDTSAGTVLADMRPTGAPASSRLQYEIVRGDAAGLFAIHPRGGKLRTSSVIPSRFGKGERHYVRVRVRDLDRPEIQDEVSVLVRFVGAEGAEGGEGVAA